MKLSDGIFAHYGAKLEPQQATVATAHKIARVVYHLLKEHEAFEKTTALEYDQHCRERELRHLEHKAAKLGYALTPSQPLRDGAVP